VVRGQRDEGKSREETRGEGAHHLKTDDATTDDNHLLGDLLQRKSAGGRDHALLVNLQAHRKSDVGDRALIKRAERLERQGNWKAYGKERKADDIRAGGDDDVLGAELLLAALGKINGHFVGAGDLTETLDVLDLNV